MLFVILICVLIVALILLIGVLPWVSVYWPSPDQETKEYITKVIGRTRAGYITWAPDKEREDHFLGLDWRKDIKHEFNVLGFSARFMRSYTPIGSDGYTFNKTQLKSISIQPWYPMWRLHTTILEQMNGKFPEPDDMEEWEITESRV